MNEQIKSEPIPNRQFDAQHRDMGQVLQIGGTYNLAGVSCSGAMTLVVDTLYAIPFLVPRRMTWDGIGLYIYIAGGAGTKARLGIYGNGTNLYPGDLILDAGTIDVDANGAAYIVIAQQLAKGLYWLAAVSDGTPQIQSGIHSAGFNVLGYRSPFVNKDRYQQWEVAQSYGALPDPYTAGGSLTWTRQLGLAMRLASLD